MSAGYTDYHEAYNAAVTLARQCNIDVAIRRTKEFGKDGFNVGFANRNDNDYAKAEIVTPKHPHTARKEQGK